MTKSTKHRLIFVGLGVLLLLLGLRGVALQVAGKSAQAKVTQVKKATSSQDDQMDHNYRILYRFAVNGKDYTGSLTQKKVYNTLTLPSVGAMVPIRYLPSAPSINGSVKEGILSGLLFGVLGIVVLIVGLKPGRPAAAQAPPRDTHADAQG